MNCEKYYQVLGIKDPKNMSNEDKLKWEKLVSLSPTARGYIVKAKEQNVDILDCLSKESLYIRYNTHADLETISKILNIQPKKVILKGKTALYFDKDLVDKLDTFFKEHSAKEVRKIVEEQHSLENYGVRSYKQSERYKNSISKVVKETWQKTGYREKVSKAVKDAWLNKTNEERELKKQHIKTSIKPNLIIKQQKIKAYRDYLQATYHEPFLDITDVRKYLDISWGSLETFEKALNLRFETFKIYNLKFLRKSDVDKAKKILDNISTCRSLVEDQLLNFVKSIYDGTVRNNDRRTLKSLKELDIYLPAKKLAFEFDGLYWHSDAAGLKKGELPSKELKQYSVNRHLSKTKECEELGIRLIHIFEDDWIFKGDIIKSIIRSALGLPQKKIYARNCELREIPVNQYRAFLNQNHLQGYSYANIRLGLFEKTTDELVELIGVNVKGTHCKEPELVRLCTKLNTQVLGGFSKLLKHTNLDYLVSYIDRSIFSGTGYSEIGFKPIKVNPPTYFYVKVLERKSRYTFTRKNIERLFKAGKLEYWNPNETEESNMYKNGYGRIWNCGTIKVEWVKNSKLKPRLY